MRGNPSAGDLVPLDLEIEATCRRNNAERRMKILQDRIAQPSTEEPQSSESSSIFPEPREPKVGAFEADIMAGHNKKIHFQHRLFTTFYTGFKIDVESTDVECIIFNIGF